MIHLKLVLDIHKAVLQTGAGLNGQPDTGKLSGALARVESYQQYENTQDVFEIAALYAVAIARAHAFIDGNKRTAMVTMLAYLDINGISIEPDCGLDDLMVKVAAGEVDYQELAQKLSEISR